MRFPQRAGRSRRGAKGTGEQIRAHSIDDFHGRVAGLFPSLAPRVSEISGWDDVRTLTVQLNRLRQWHAPGLLCIGDAAHAMSPVGGVGINLAIQDAVAAGRIIIRQLERGPLNSRTLASIQRRRWLPTVATQFGQRMAHRFFIRRVLEEHDTAPCPIAAAVVGPFPPPARGSRATRGSGNPSRNGGETTPHLSILIQLPNLLIAVDPLHAASMLPLAPPESTRRRPAVISAACAVSSALELMRNHRADTERNS